jgi:GntR family transcriptional regulator / MocR family aminotransferase
VTAAIEDGVLEPGARLPSWHDLAAQLGVARGTVWTAYEKLAAVQLIEASRATDARVAQRPRTVVKTEPPPDAGSFMRIYQEMTQGPALFQMGIPATETFPATLFARIRAPAVRAEASASPLCPDPRGELELRREIAGYLAVARGITCLPSQVIITGGFSAGLGLALSVLGWAGKRPGSRPQASRGPERDLSSHACPSLRFPLIPTVSISIMACATILTPSSSS